MDEIIGTECRLQVPETGETGESTSYVSTTLVKLP